MAVRVEAAFEQGSQSCWDMAAYSDADLDADPERRGWHWEESGTEQKEQRGSFVVEEAVKSSLLAAAGTEDYMMASGCAVAVSAVVAHM